MIDWLIIGEMYHDDELARTILHLIKTARQHRTQVLLTDRVRYSFRTIVSHQLINVLERAAEYPIIDRAKSMQKILNVHTVRLLIFLCQPLLS